MRRSFSLDELRPHLAAGGIGGTVVVQTVCLAEETPELLALAEAAPEVAGVVGWVELCSTVGDASLVYDLIVLPHQLPAVVETVAAMEAVSFVLDHGGKPPVASGAVSPWREQVMALGRLPNVAVKLSGLVTEADVRSWTVGDLRPYVGTMLEAFGPERTTWGSDWPVCLLAASYEQWLSAAEELVSGLGTWEREAVFGGAASRWYSLER